MRGRPAQSHVVAHGRALAPRQPQHDRSALGDGVDDRLGAGVLDALDPGPGGGEVDLMQEYAAQIPSRVISRLLGVPGEDRERIRLLIDECFHLDEEHGFVNDVALTAMGELGGYLDRRLRHLAEEPGDDLLSALTGAGLTRRETIDFAMLLVMAGTETVGRLLGWAALLLDEHPDQRADLVADPALVPQAVEEVLREVLDDGQRAGVFTVEDLDATLALIHACLAPRGLAPESVATFVLRAVSAP